MNEKVSVVIPAYNREYCLHLALASVFAQTYAEIEAIVVDDASTDGTEVLCRSFAAVFGDRVVYIRNPSRVGASASRNIGIAASHGKFVTFLDSDDVYYPDKIEKQVRLLESTGKGFCCCFYATTRDIYNLSDRTLCWWNAELPLYPNFLLPQNPWIVTPGVMVLRDILKRYGGFEEKMNTCEDLDLWSRILKFTGSAILQEVMICIGLRNEKMRYFENILARDILYRRLFERDKSLTAQFKKLLYSDLIHQYRHHAENNNEPASLLEKLDTLRGLCTEPLEILMMELPRRVSALAGTYSAE
jgi:glycosyltransferase involved in cell wall biosynthesis